MTGLRVPEHSQHDKMCKNGEGCTLHSENGDVSRWCWGGCADNSNRASNRGLLSGKALKLTQEKASTP